MTAITKEEVQRRLIEAGNADAQRRRHAHAEGEPCNGSCALFGPNDYYGPATLVPLGVLAEVIADIVSAPPQAKRPAPQLPAKHPDPGAWFKPDVWRMWQEHSQATGHTEYDSDDEYAISCRECPYDEHACPTVTFFHEPKQACDGYKECPRWAAQTYVHPEHEADRHYCSECKRIAMLDGWLPVPTGNWSILHGDEHEALDMVDFVRTNAATLDVLELAGLHQLAPAQSRTFGGGAVPRITLRRICR